MRQRIWDQKLVRMVAVSIMLAALSLLFLTIYLQLWRADLSVPLAYNWDSLMTGALVKGLIENGWYLENEALGMPFGADTYDFPKSSTLHFVLLKLISLITSDWATTLNLYFLLSCPLTTLAAYFVFREFRLAALPSAVCSLLFAFVHYYFWRGEGHLLYSTYYMVPLSVMVILWLYEGKITLVDRNEASGKIVFRLRDRRLIAAVVILLLTASTQFYFAFFTCLFLAMAGVLSAFRLRSLFPIITGATLGMVILAGVLVNVLPHLAYRSHHGTNDYVAQRPLQEVDKYSLTISQMLLPVRGHRIHDWWEARKRYDAATFVPSEPGAPTLGLLASLGFLGLLAFQFAQGFHRFEGPVFSLVRGLAAVNLGAVLFALVGGGGSLFAFLVTPQLRAYNRISIYIAFFSIFALCIALDWLSSKYPQSLLFRWTFPILLGLILIGGLLDQTSLAYVPDHQKLSTRFHGDRSFIRSIENQVPLDSMIFQLPYVPYPENPPVFGMTDYEHLKPYLHSRELKWSYGSMKGRMGDLWQQIVSKLEPEEMVRVVCAYGFSGIYLDRRGYPDRGAQMESELRAILGRVLLENAGGDQVFFDLTAYRTELTKAFGGETWIEKARTLVDRPVPVRWGGGFSGEEGKTPHTWRWSNGSGELTLFNFSGLRTVEMRMEISLGPGRSSFVVLKGDLIEESVQVTGGEKISRVFDLPTGTHRILFTCDAPPINAPADPRRLVFRILNFDLSPVPKEDQGERLPEKSGS